ncbi:hypothetical protein [Nocardia stercoris]|uniref:Uncharacterized protein n=1 Tax=Nocardia stercoris TaxID=2483361 RepID=A0A3M2L7C1_9NOCA|nr:hypothetical protein [Nocardia stercoris]RMI31805.1 hypothetical protein EBN03_16600 [Nocardia stercoris]
MDLSFLPAAVPADQVRPELVAAAFGARPGCAAAELPVAVNPAESWLRAVVLGGQGHYAAARAELAELRRAPAVGPSLRSLATSTEASLWRQLGWHGRAAVLDGPAAALAVVTPDSLAAAQARCDALTGLAADGLGTGRPNLSARLLQRCRRLIDTQPVGARVLLRWHWVTAETALAGGLPGVDPRTHAEAALALADASSSVRHRIKSTLLVAAAAAAAGDLARSRTLAEEVASGCAEHGLVPLRWAAAMLRAGIAAAPGAAAAAGAEAAECAHTLALRGGRFRSGPDVLARH